MFNHQQQQRKSEQILPSISTLLQPYKPQHDYSCYYYCYCYQQQESAIHNEQEPPNKCLPPADNVGTTVELADDLNDIDPAKFDDEKTTTADQQSANEEKTRQAQVKEVGDEKETAIRPIRTSRSKIDYFEPSSSSFSSSCSSSTKDQQEKNNGKEKQTTKPYKERKRRFLPLWRFLLQLLADNKHPNEITWTNKSLGEFKLLNVHAVARLWGAYKNCRRMNYAKLSRSLRYYYPKGIIKKTRGRRYVYRFGGVANQSPNFSTNNESPPTTKKLTRRKK